VFYLKTKLDYSYIYKNAQNNKSTLNVSESWAMSNVQNLAHLIIELV